MKETSAPDAAGWWARKRNGRIEWFRIELLTDGHDTASMAMIYVSEIEDFVSLHRFCGPLTKWFGPVYIPWEDM